MENISLLGLNSLVRLSDIEKIRKAAIYVLIYLGPEFDVETRVHF